MEFLQHEEGWRESYKANGKTRSKSRSIRFNKRFSGYLQLVESKLKGLTVAVRLKKPNMRFDAVKDYSITFHTNLNSLLKTRSKVAERQYTVYKLHANYGRVFSEWSAIERDMGDALQKTGHYLDTLASSVDSSLEDEELLADQLKEYLFFAISIQNVCKNQEILQLELEDAEDNVANKNVERTKVQQGKTSLMSRLFGAVDTDEVRELKVNLLDQQIQEGASAVHTSKEQLT